MFEPLAPHVGGVIVAREIHEGRIWAARALRPLHATSELLVAHLPLGSTWLRPVKPDGAVHRIPEAPWKLATSSWPYDTIWFVPAGAPFAIHTMRSSATDELRGWYINVQEPVRVTELGIDYLDHTLDVVVAPDLDGHELKDEDELELGLERGLYDRNTVSAIRAAAEEGLTFLHEHQDLLASWSDAGRAGAGPVHLPSDLAALGETWPTDRA